MNRSLLLLILLGGLGWSCSRGLDVVLPFGEKRLVILAILAANDSVKVQVDHTYPPTGQLLFSEGVTNARVLLYENDQLLDTLRRTFKNNYAARSNIRPVVGQTYRITVDAPGYPPLESLPETIPPFPTIRQTVLENKEGDYQLTTTIQDTPGLTSQYELRLVSYYKQWETAINLRNLLRPDEANDNCSFRGNLNTFYFRDVCFENSLLTTRFGSSLRGTPQGRPDPPRDSVFTKAYESNPVAGRVVIRVRSINEAYLNYQQYSPFTDIGQAFVLPTSRYTNLKGGYGIVLSYAERSVVLAVP